MFTSPPITMPRSAAVPTATRPVLIPTCTSMGNGSPSSRPSCGARSTTESAARIARTASSSCDVGTPNTVSTASPMNDSARPRSHSTSSVTIRWNAASTSRKRSGSRCDASFVEPTRSTKTTVTSRRSEAGSIATGAPQCGQNLAPGGSRSSHRAHVASLTPQGYGGPEAGTRPERCSAYPWPRILAFCAWNSASVSTPLARRSARRSSSVTVEGASGDAGRRRRRGHRARRAGTSAAGSSRPGGRSSSGLPRGCGSP